MEGETRERQSPDWQSDACQSGDWRSRATPWRCLSEACPLRAPLQLNKRMSRRDIPTSETAQLGRRLAFPSLSNGYGIIEGSLRFLKR